MFFWSFAWLKSTSFIEVDFPKRTFKIIKESKKGREVTEKNLNDVFGLVALTYDIEADDANHFLMVLTSDGSWKCIIFLMKKNK